jgi:hypothetical protein
LKVPVRPGMGRPPAADRPNLKPEPNQ